MTVKVVLVDNFDDDVLADESVTFALDDSGYHLDLTAEHAKELREALLPYVDVATPLGRVELPSPAHPSHPGATPRPTAAVEAGKPWYAYRRHDNRRAAGLRQQYRQLARQWWREQGHEIGERGIVPYHAMDAFNAHRREQGLPTGPEAVGLA